MATNDYTQRIASLEEKMQPYEKALKSSPTAQSSGATPSSVDLRNEANLRNLRSQLDSVRNKQLQERWYGPEEDQTADTSGGAAGFVGSTLNRLATPLYATVGLLEAATGTGTKKGFANVAENIKEKETFSNLLKKADVPYAAAAPLGFVLDVAFDPVNWITAGSAATIPRLGMGLVKGTAKKGVEGGVEAAAKGVGANLLQGASLVTKPFGLVSKSAKNASKALGRQAGKYDDIYNDIIGRNVEEMAKFGGAGIGPYRVRLGDMIEEGFNNVGGKGLFETLNYDNKGWLTYSYLRDAVERNRLVKDIDNIEDATKAVQGLELSPQFDNDFFMRPAGEVLADMSQGKMGRSIANSFNKMDLSALPEGEAKTELLSILNKMQDEADYLVRSSGSTRTADPHEIALRLAEESEDAARLRELADDALEQMRAKFLMDPDTTGIKWYDDMRDQVKQWKIKDVPVGQNALKGYASLIQWFKQAKTGLSPSTAMANTLSGPALWTLYGGHFTPAMVGDFKDAYSFLSGKRGAQFVLNSGLLDDGSKWIQYMKDNPNTFESVLGASPTFVFGRQFVDDVMQTGRDMGLITGGSEAQVLSQLDDAMRNVRDQLQNQVEAASKDKGNIITKITQQGGREAAPSASEITREFIESGGKRGAERVSWGGQEFLEDSYLNNAKQAISDAAKANPDNVGYKILDAFMNKSMRAYERIDQAWRLALTRHMTKRGLSEPELLRIRRFNPMDEGDIIKKFRDEEGRMRYLLSPNKAIEITSDVLFNYAAMPSIVRMLRSMPLLGAPFASFMYGMLLRTGQSLAYNPMAFNKINYAINAASGEKGPLERKALEKPYYRWYNEPSMLRLPDFASFSAQHPMYLNLANLLPYFTMTIFEPPERRYETLMPGKLVETLDRSPLLKDPIGQALFDYIILPAMIAQERPVNSFGQPLYPTDASALEKAGYGTRQIADALTPTVMGVAGLVSPSEYAQYYPSYRWRNLAAAKEGENQYGIKGKEEPGSRTLRNLAGLAGFPLQRLDPTVARDEVE